MTSLSAGHITLTPTQLVGSGWPQRESNPGHSHQELRTLPTELLRPPGGGGGGGDSDIGEQTSQGKASPGGKEKGTAPQPSPASTSSRPAFDAHFHLDRMMSRERGRLSVDYIYKMDVLRRESVWSGKRQVFG